MFGKEPPEYKSFRNYILGQILKAVLLIIFILIVANELEQLRQRFFP